MATNVAGTNARLFPWQMKHYIQRGGPNDPTLQASGGPPVTTGGVLGFNSVLTFPPIPGTQTPPNVPLPRVMSLNSGGTYTTTTGIMTGNTGGILIGTIPGGSWIQNVEIYCYTALSGGTSTSVGVFYQNANAFNTQASPQPATLWVLGTKLNPATGTLYVPGTATFAAGANAVTTVGAIKGQLDGYQLGPGNGVAGSTQLASLGPPEGQGFGGLTQGAAALASGDIDIYFCSFLIAGSGTAPTGGEFGVLVEFTGQEG